MTEKLGVNEKEPAFGQKTPDRTSYITSEKEVWTPQTLDPYI